MRYTLWAEEFWRCIARRGLTKAEAQAAKFDPFAYFQDGYSAREAADDVVREFKAEAANAPEAN